MILEEFMKGAVPSERLIIEDSTGELYRGFVACLEYDKKIDRSREVIEGYRGKNFTEKLRNLVHDFARQNQEFVRQKEGEKGCGDMNRTRF